MLDTFKHYFITEHIARKSAWDIYRSYPAQEPEHTVILKIFDAECLNPTATAAHFQRTRTRLQQLTHPALLPPLDVGMEQGQPYSVTEYLPGGSLRTYLQQRSSQRLTLDETFHILLHLGQAIAYAHTQHIVHLNIKPENIFLTEKGDVLLTDFRLHNLIDEKRLGQKLDASMSSYLAPEQLIGLLPERLTQNMTPEQLAVRVGPHSDQYALGCLLYELLTGTLPCTVNDLQFFWQYIPLTPSAIVPSLSHSMDTVILRALSKRSAERYADVATFLAALSVAIQPAPPVFPFARITRTLVPAAPRSQAGGTLLPLPTALATAAKPDPFNEEPFGFTPASLEIVKDSSGMLPSVRISQDGHEQAQLLSSLQEDDFLTMSSALYLDQPQAATAQSIITNDATQVLPSPPLAETALENGRPASSNHASTVGEKSVFVPQLRHEKRRSTILLILALLCSISATLLASIFNPAIIIALQKTPATLPTLAQLNPAATQGTTSTWSTTATRVPTATPKPRATPKPKATPKPTAMPKSLATPVASVQAAKNPPPAPTATPIPAPTATTTNVARNATVTASSDFPSDGWSLAAVHDGQTAETSTAPGWSSNNDVNANHTESLQFDFGSKQYIDEMDVYICNNSGATGYGMPINFTIDVSNDAQTWTTVVTRTNYPAPTTAALQSFGFSLQNVRYIRIFGSSLRQSSSDINQYRMQFAEVEVY